MPRMTSGTERAIRQLCAGTNSHAQMQRETYILYGEFWERIDSEFASCIFDIVREESEKAIAACMDQDQDGEQ